MQELSNKEIDERVAILKRFKTLLIEQRDKFREYLIVLEQQQKSITDENIDALLAHTELEQQVVENISGLQKVIVPMSEMYSDIRNETSDTETEDVELLKTDLQKLQLQILEQNEKNRNLLRVHISQIKNKMTQIKNPYRGNKSVYAQKQNVGNLVEVQA